MRSTATKFWACWCLFGFLSAPSLSAGEIDPDRLAALKARAIGPAAMSGRIAAIDVWSGNTDHIVIGAATGGVWRSENAGLTWAPIFDDQPVHAVGAVKIHPDHTDVIWVGTGEGNPRNSASVGNGIYKTLDGGRTWQHLGLERSERIHRILIDPKDPETVYVAAMGRLWGENRERGVFKTTDGGKTWSHVLAVDERTGCADLVIDPRNPKKMIAAMWDYRRWPWFFRSGGPGSGLYITYDGGESWKRLESGLPQGDLGRIGLAIAPSDPDIVYALVEAKQENALYRSDDGGESWRRVGAGENVGNRPFYYADLRVDPQNPDRVYSLWSLVSVSDDGGKNFRILVNWNVHPDHHAMWINPTDPSHIIDGNDGGIAISHDRGKTWRFVRNLPLAQFYHVRVDNDVPYNVYGGLQDNGSWRGPSRIWESGGIRNHHWREVCFGDGFDTIPDPRDSMRGYAMSQGGALVKWDLHTGLRKSIQPVGPEGTELRFNWSAGFAMHPEEPDTIYFGSQFVHRSKDGGIHWEIVSEDLTTDDPQWQRQAESGGLTLDVTDAENFCSIVALSVSSIDPEVVWAGTDDGRLHVSRDGGDSWVSVERNVPEVPRNTWIPHIEPSRFNSGAAFVVFDDHRRSNWTPYVLKTTDYGRSWERLSIRGVRGYALSIVQDPVDPNLLFLGTEFGLYVTFDGGARWHPYRHGIPTSSVMDLAIQEREGDLVVGTHGRGLFVLDDYRPLRELKSDDLDASLVLFPPRDAQQYWRRQPASSRFGAAGEYSAPNVPYGALLTVIAHPEKCGAKPGDKLEVEIRDEDGALVRRFRRSVSPGLDRFSWNLRRDGFRRPSPQPSDPDADRPTGAEVLPGTYSVTLKLGDQSVTEPLTVLADPRFSISKADREANLAARDRVGRILERAAEAVDTIREMRDDIALAKRKAKDVEEDEREEFDASVTAVEEALSAIEPELWTRPGGKGITRDRSAVARVGSIGWPLGSSWDRPTRALIERIDRGEAQLDAVLERLDAVCRTEYEEFRAQIDELGLEFAPPRRVGKE